MNNSELTKTIHQILELKRLAEEISAEMEELTDKVKREMTALDVDTLIVDVHKITWKPVVSTRIDSASLKKSMPDVYTQFSKTTSSKRFLIS